MGWVALVSLIVVSSSAAGGPIAPPWAAPAAPPSAKAITALERQLDAAAASDPGRADLMMRLAELCQRSADPSVRQRGLDLLRRLAGDKAFARYARRDEALFSLGVALAAAGDLAGSRTAFMTLVRDIPTSSRVPLVYAHFGDHFFASGNMKNAASFYDKVLQFPKSPAYTYALYKRGWVFINEADHQRALETFFKVHRLAPAGSPIRRGARDALPVAYAPVGKPSRARAFFSRIDRGAAAAMLERLAEIYADGGQSAEAIICYRELIAGDPTSPSLCQWQAGVARAARLGSSRPEAARELARLRAIGTPECRRLADEIAAMP